MDNIYKIEELHKLNLKNMSFSEPKHCGGHIFFIENCLDFYIQTKNMKCVNNIYKNNNKMYINFSIGSEELIDFFIKIDNIVLKMLVDNYEKWFGENKKPVEILEYYMPTVIHKNNNKFFIIEIPLDKDNNIDINIYNEDGKIINNNKLESINNPMIIIRFNGVYLENSRLYCNWEIIQMKVVNVSE